MRFNELDKYGYTVICDLYTVDELQQIAAAIEQADATKPTFKKAADLFAIRQFLKEIPVARALIFNQKLLSLIDTYFGNDYFVVKSIYFDKPPESNWFVAWHQDLTISVDKKIDLPGFGPWTVKQDQFAVQPPVEILENIFTIRLHLDDTDENNGALKVIPGSHRQGVQRYDPDTQKAEVSTCRVPKGGIMIMKPLVLHASSRTTSGRRRRVIHIEFSNKVLPEELSWSEAFAIN